MNRTNQPGASQPKRISKRIREQIRSVELGGRRIIRGAKNRIPKYAPCDQRSLASIEQRLVALFAE